MIARRSDLGGVLGDQYIPLPPPKPPSPGALVGPDKWWNPFSPQFPTARAGAAVADALRAKSAEIADATAEAANALKAKIPDPVIAAETIVGKPTWGYYVPTVLLGVGGVLAVGLGGALAYRHYRKRA